MNRPAAVRSDIFLQPVPAAKTTEHVAAPSKAKNRRRLSPSHGTNPARRRRRPALPARPGRRRTTERAPRPVGLPGACRRTSVHLGGRRSRMPCGEYPSEPPKTCAPTACPRATALRPCQRTAQPLRLRVRVLRVVMPTRERSRPCVMCAGDLSAGLAYLVVGSTRHGRCWVSGRLLICGGCHSLGSPDPVIGLSRADSTGRRWNTWWVCRGVPQRCSGVR